MLITLLLLGALGLPAQDSRPTADDCAQQAWQLLPAYGGVHRAYLSADVSQDVQAAVHLLRAATALETENVRALWGLGHAQVLLAENARNRGWRVKAKEHFQGALGALGRALELSPEDPWCAYARGAARTEFGQHDLALADLEQAITHAEAVIDESGEPGAMANLRFKALEWRTEVLMRAQRSADSRAALKAFHAEFSNNSWPLQIALAESYEREWDLDGARAAYQTAAELFPEDDQAHALLGYLEGLLGNEQAAVKHLQDAIGLEFSPGLYARLWLTILATGEARQTAEADLAELLANPPGALAEWDLRLGRFLLGEGEASSFIAAGEAELERRIGSEEPADDLMSEVYFYAGVRLERTGAEGALTASHCYQFSLQERPVKWKWEWAYSRLYLARVLNPDAAPSFTVRGDQFRSPNLEGTLYDARWNILGSATSVEALGREPQCGDLLMGTLVDAYGRRAWITRVMGER
ncbi:MAG: tetratricopeptide (TPR) repeat protein [Candidatus Paceibacteria bacterium]|jgi:tetratricopeptide (TPR) repeat protein